MSGHLEQIRLDSYKPLRELVCEHIRQAIINGTFAPGERLMEIQLADEMGVSRTPVREAIRKLELEGFDPAARHLCGRYVPQGHQRRL